jgi:hypothetical protein
VERKASFFYFALVLVVIGLSPATGLAQGRQERGKSIGKVSTMGNLILLELNEGALGKANLFDLSQRTLRFVPGNDGYRVENLPLSWDPDFGSQIEGSDVTLQAFKFPFSGQMWNSFSVGSNGSIRFAGPAANAGAGLGASDRARGAQSGRLGGVQIGRFDQLAVAARSLINTVPAICVFMKPRLLGARYAKELPDRVVITWDLSEPWGNIQDFTWAKTVNRFQAVLHKDATIEMSYDQVAAKDAIVGLYPMAEEGNEKLLTTIPGEENAGVPANLDVRGVKLSVTNGLFLRVTLETRGPVLHEGDPALAGLAYRVLFNAEAPGSATHDSPEAGAVWMIRGFAPRNGSDGSSRYVASGQGVLRQVRAKDNTISIEGILPLALRGSAQASVSVEVMAPESTQPVDRIAPHTVRLTGLRSPEVDLSSMGKDDGPLPVVFESFHYLDLPNPRDMACTVIQTLGDKFDFLAYYSDFRVDNQEAGTPSNGPRGAVGDPVAGIGDNRHDLQSYCSQGRFQWQFIQPVYVGSNQMQERPPAGAPVGNDHDITFYRQQLAEHSQDGKIPPYMYAMSQIGHEMGHRWGAFVSAKVNGEIIPLGPTHWARGLQAQVAFPYQRPTEASAMGGGVWQDNLDGTFTQLDDDYYVPATGWSYLDLYLMGMISPAEVPGFFLLRNLVPAGTDANGHSIFKADRTKITIQDVIAAEGPRTPGVENSQRKFNTGMVMVVEHGSKPSRELMERTEGIREQWLKYWPITTGRRSTMTANPN